MSTYVLSLEDRTVKVLLLDDQQQYDFTRKQLKHPDAEKQSVACSVYWEDENTAQECGVLIFHREALGSGVVAHEAVHMAVDYCRAKLAEFDPVHNDLHNEWLATVTEELVRQFWSNFYTEQEAAA